MTNHLCRLAAGLVLALLLAAGAAGAEANTTVANGTATAAWERVIGGPGNESLLALVAPGDGYRLVGGLAMNATGPEVVLVRFDVNGTIAGERRVPFGDGRAAAPAMANLTPDGGTVVVGTAAGARAGDTDVAVLAIGPDDRPRWFRTYSAGTGLEEGAVIRPAGDGGYLVAGTTDLPTGGAPQLLLVRVGIDGGEIWHRVIPLGADTLAVRDLQPTADGGYLVVGSTDAGRPGSLAILLLRVSSGGTLSWQRAYAFGVERAAGRTVAPHPSGGWIVLGDAGGADLPNAAVVVRVGTDGTEQWRKRVAADGTATWGYALAPIGTSGFALAGATGPLNDTDSWVARLDRDAAVIWNRTIPVGDGPSRALAVIAAPDRFAVAGEAEGTAGQGRDLYLTLVPANGTAPNATATPVPNATVNATATATPAPSANATTGAATTVPATTAAPLSPAACLAALGAGAVLVAARRRR